MTRRLMIACMAVLVLATTVDPALCAGVKLAVVDMERLVRAHPRAESSEALLKAQVEEFEEEQKDMLSEEEKLKEQFAASRDAAQNKALSDSAREERVEDAKEKYVALREYEMKRLENARLRKKQLADQQLRLRRRIVSDIQSTIKGYADEQGISMVFDSSAVSMRGIESVVCHADKMDITEAMLKLVKRGATEGE